MKTCLKAGAFKTLGFSAKEVYNNLMDSYQPTTLKNGLKLITVPMPQIESVAVMVAVAAGSRNEIKRVNGLFHFIEHMAFKGTKRRPRAIDIAAEVDSVGGQSNAFTDKEITAYHLKLASKHTELAFDILSDMLTNSIFKAEEIEKERGVIIEELNLYEDTPMLRVRDVFSRLLYGDNPMGWDTGGEKEGVKKIQRNDFLTFQERFYFAQNLAVVVAGDLNQEKIRQLTQKYFGGFRKSGRKVTKEITLDQEKPRVKLVNKKTEQAHFCLGVPGVSLSHPERFTMAVLASILGGGMSSRLWHQIRGKRGLAYYVFTQPEFYTDSGFLMTQSGVRLKKIDEAIKVVLTEFQDLANKKVSAKELNKAKEYLKGGMILALEDSMQVATRYAHQALLEKEMRTPQEAMKLINKVTAEDIQRVAKKLFQPKNLNLAIIGPYREENRFRKLLGA